MNKQTKYQFFGSFEIISEEGLEKTVVRMEDCVGLKYAAPMFCARLARETARPFTTIAEAASDLAGMGGHCGPAEARQLEEAFIKAGQAILAFWDDFDLAFWDDFDKRPREKRPAK